MICNNDRSSLSTRCNPLTSFLNVSSNALYSSVSLFVRFAVKFILVKVRFTFKAAVVVFSTIILIMVLFKDKEELLVKKNRHFSSTHNDFYQSVRTCFPCSCFCQPPLNYTTVLKKAIYRSILYTIALLIDLLSKRKI